MRAAGVAAFSSSNMSLIALFKYSSYTHNEHIVKNDGDDDDFMADVE